MSDIKRMNIIAGAMAAHQYPLSSNKSIGRVPAILSGDAWSKFCAAQIINTLPYARKEEESKAKVIYDRLSPGTLLSAVLVFAFGSSRYACL